jgi:thiamine biosynthesis lipoprotein
MEFMQENFVAKLRAALINISLFSPFHLIKSILPMKIRSWLLPFFLLIYSNLLAQGDVVYLKNPSFEGVPSAGDKFSKFNLENWVDCGMPGESPPDIYHSKTHFFNFTRSPYNGDTFLGLVARKNGTFESVSQKLSKPILADSSYSFSIYLCHSDTFLSASDKGDLINYNTPVILRIFGGNGACQQGELLAVSPAVSNLDWKKYDFNLSPKKNYSHILLEAFFSSGTTAPYAGNLLLDNASNIVLNKGKIHDVASLNNYIGENKLTHKRYEFADTLMGTRFRMILYANEADIAQVAAQKAFARLQALDSILSDYREDSEISQLSNKAGKDEAMRVSSDLYQVLSYALEVSKKSNGAFDVTAGALTKLWRRAFRQKEVPPQAEIAAARETAGFKNLKLYDDNSLRLLKPGTRLDLGGIAKGYAVDEAMKILKAAGITSALVDGGGDIATSNPPPGEMGWLIDKFVYKNGQVAAEPLVISNRAIATSGDTYRYLEWEGKRYSHILDPRTGMGTTSRKIVTVMAPTCMEADAWATAMSVEVDPKAFLALEKKGISVSFSLY